MLRFSLLYRDRLQLDLGAVANTFDVFVSDACDGHIFV